MSLGVTYSGEPPPSHHHIPTLNPDSLEDRKMGLGCIPTTVQLKDIRHIDIWYSDDGCLGLEVTFSSGHNDTLGRWDPKSPDFNREVVFDSEDDEQPFESMEIWMSDYFYKNRVGNGATLSVRSNYYTVNGISVGKRSVGDLKGDKCLVASVDVTGYFSYVSKCCRVLS
jgi:hypothetical protein